jgi:hypothetical protein
LFLERKKGEWYYILERYDSPKGAWDWLDYADAFGPFESEEKTREHLFANHANPGGHSMLDAEFYSAMSKSQKEKYEDLIKYTRISASTFF